LSSSQNSCNSYEDKQMAAEIRQEAAWRLTHEVPVHLRFAFPADTDNVHGRPGQDKQGQKADVVWLLVNTHHESGPIQQ